MNSVTVSNNPIIIVDGARIEATPSGIQPGQSQISSGRLGDLAMSEVESIEVVKGPAAATLYGTDAANGVIVIRTKHGQPGATRWQLNGEAPYANATCRRLSWVNSEALSVTCDQLYPVLCHDNITKYSPVDDPTTFSLTALTDK